MEIDIRGELFRLAEPEYQKFNSRLIPNIKPETMLGVRLPALRKLAAKLAKGDWRTYLETAQNKYYEEIMLQGMVIGCAKMEFEERLSYIKWFLPKMDNWAVCDSFCSSLKAVGRYTEEMWPFIRKCLADNSTYVIRFGAVMLLDYYMDEAWIDEALKLLDEVRHDDYYVKMAVAWSISIYYVKFPKQVMPYLLENSLDDFTYNKALQKITESRRIGKEEKERIRQMKRKV
ncbi:DNA alkylation repair protein [Lachnospiraceae bacterium 46-15]